MPSDHAGAADEVGTRAGTARLTFTVCELDTAIALGSGDVPVLATPRLLAWCEAASVAAAGDLGPGRTSVGTRVELEHQRASRLGAVVTVEARLAHRDGRLLRFEVRAEQQEPRVEGSGESIPGAPGPLPIAVGSVTRVVVDRDQFRAG